MKSLQPSPIKEIGADRIPWNEGGNIADTPHTELRSSRKVAPIFRYTQVKSGKSGQPHQNFHFFDNSLYLVKVYRIIGGGPIGIFPDPGVLPDSIISCMCPAIPLAFRSPMRLNLYVKVSRKYVGRVLAF